MYIGTGGLPLKLFSHTNHTSDIRLLIERNISAAITFYNDFDRVLNQCNVANRRYFMYFETKNSRFLDSFAPSSIQIFNN